MNRIIKFRAWDDGKMVYFKDIQHLDKEDYEVLRLAKFFCNIRNDSILMQFTGLKDKNGKDIYEGDVVVTPKGICAVTYELGCFYTITESRYRLGGWDGVVEIIGNIYQHPELLTNK